eukprot:g2563.t1
MTEADTQFSDDPVLRLLQRRHKARGMVARKPLVMQKPLQDIVQDVREKLLKLGHPTYRRLWDFAGKPQGNVDLEMFLGILRKLGMHLAREDAKYVLCVLCEGAAELPFRRFCQMIAQDQTKNWDEIRSSATEKINRGKFTIGMDGGTKRLRPDIRDEVLHARQSRAAESLNSSHVLKRGVEAVAYERLHQKSRSRVLLTKLVHRIFNPRLVAADLPAAPQKLRRLCRASTFVNGLRKIGVALSDNMARETVRKYQVQIESNGTPTKLVDLEHFLNVGEARADSSKSPASKIIQHATKTRNIGKPNRGIKDDTGIRRIGTPELKGLILKKIDERSRPKGGGPCLEAFKMFSPGVARGAITPRYFQKRLADHGLILQKSRSDKLLREVDVDGSGNISFTEFVNHFVPRGIKSGSLTEKLARGSSNISGVEKNVPETKLNLTLHKDDRALVQQRFGLKEKSASKKYSRQLQSKKRKQVVRFLCQDS